MKKPDIFVQLYMAFGMAVVLLSGCAHTPASTCCLTKIPGGMSDRTLESFGKFDLKTTYGDLIARVGKPDDAVDISGRLFLSYYLTNDALLTVEINGSAKDAYVFKVSLQTNLYSRNDALQNRPDYNLDGVTDRTYSFDREYSLESRDFTLSLKNPLDPETKIRLLSVRAGSITTIQLDSGEKVLSMPGNYFACEQLGKHELQLISASHETGEAVFRQTRCVGR